MLAYDALERVVFALMEGGDELLDIFVRGAGAEFGEGEGEAIFFDGLHEVIDGVDGEGLQGVLIIGGDEDDGGGGGGGNGCGDFETGESGHLDIEEDGIGFECGDGFEGGEAVGCFADDLDVGVDGE